MRVAKIALKHESERELFFAHRPISGIIFSVLGAGFGYLPTYFGADDWTRWIFGGFGAFFAAIGILGAFWRYELRLDLITRRYTRRRGLWPAVKVTTGSLNDLDAVLLTQEWSRASSKHGSSEHPFWKISLLFKSWDKPVSIEAVNTEQKGHERLEYFAKKLQVDAVDRTKSSATRRPFGELDQTIRQQSGSQGFDDAQPTNDPRFPPPQSGITVTDSMEGLRLTLPAHGFNAGLVLFGLFGLVFAGFGLFFIIVKSGLYTEITGQTLQIKENPPGAGWTIAGLFTLIGCAIMMFGVIASYGREQIAARGNELIYRFTWLGRSFRTVTMDKSAVEELDLRANIAPRRRRRGSITIGGTSVGTSTRAPIDARAEVFIRTDQRTLRLGRHLNDDGKQWLIGAMRNMITG